MVGRLFTRHRSVAPPPVTFLRCRMAAQLFVQVLVFTQAQGFTQA